MKFVSPLDTERYPNSTFVERIVDGWNPPEVSGEMELGFDPAIPNKVCFRFCGTLSNSAMTVCWTLDELFFQHPALIAALEMVTQRFLESIVDKSFPPGRGMQHTGPRQLVHFE